MSGTISIITNRQAAGSYGSSSRAGNGSKVQQNAGNSSLERMPAFKELFALCPASEIFRCQSLSKKFREGCIEVLKRQIKYVPGILDSELTGKKAEPALVDYFRPFFTVAESILSRLPSGKIIKTPGHS